MWGFIARRVLYAVPILLGVSFVVFLLMKMVPGDAADILIPPEAPKEVAAMIRALRPRSADPYSIPSLAAGDGERRLRRLHFHQPAGRRRAVRRARQHPQTRVAGRLPWLLARCAARRACRLLQWHLARQTVLGRRRILK